MQGHENAGNEVQGTQNNQAKHVRHGPPKNVETIRNWSSLDAGQGQNYRTTTNGVHFGSKQDLGKNWRPVDASIYHIQGGALQQVRGSPGDMSNGKLWTRAGEIGGVVNLDSPIGSESPSPGVLSHLQDIESQVGWLRGEFGEMKKAISHLTTFVQILNTDIRNNSSKMKNYHEGLVGIIESMHSCLRIVEAKVDCIRTSKSNSPAAIIGMEDNEDMGEASKVKARQLNNK